MLKNSNATRLDSAKEHASEQKKPRRENASIEIKIKVLDWYEKNGKNQTKPVKHFSSLYPNTRISQATISNWVKQSEELKKEWGNGGCLNPDAKRVVQTQHPDVNEMLELWVSKAMSDGLILTGDILRKKWEDFADLAGIPTDERLRLSQGWLTRFKARNGLKNFKRHGEAGSVDPGTIELERARIQELLQDRSYELKDIYNMDETGLFYA